MEITTDCQYLIVGITKGLVNWKRRHWWKKRGPIRNVDLWMELDELVAIHQTTMTWTKGHAGHEDNNHCDWLAQNAAMTQTSSCPGSPHAPLRLNLGRDFIPPKPQLGLFEVSDSSDEDEEDDNEID